MSMESELGRIATALEALVGLKKAAGTTVPSIEPAKKTTAAKLATAPAAEKEETQVAGPTAALPAEPEDGGSPITLDQVLVALRQFADLKGADRSKALMVKYGADAKAPKSKDIKPANYAKLMKEIKES